MKELQMDHGRSDIIIGIIAMAIGGIILLLAKTQNLVIWSKGQPGGGLFPIVAGGIIVFCGCLIILSELLSRRKGSKESPYTIKTAELRNLGIISGIALLVALGSEKIGMIPCITGAMILYVRLLGKETWKKSILIGGLAGVVIYLIFVVFLKVHFPKGIIGI